MPESSWAMRCAIMSEARVAQCWSVYIRYALRGSPVSVSTSRLSSMGMSVSAMRETTSAAISSEWSSTS